MTTFNEVPVGSIIKFYGRYLVKIKQAIPDRKPHDQGCNCIMLTNLHRMTLGWNAKVELLAHPDEIDDVEDFGLVDEVKWARNNVKEETQIRNYNVNDTISINSSKDDMWYEGEPKNAGTYVLTIRDCRGHDSVVTATRYGGKWSGFPLQTTAKIVAYKRIEVNPLLEPYDDGTVFFNGIERGDGFECEGKQYIRLSKKAHYSAKEGIYFNSYCIDNRTFCYFRDVDRVLKSSCRMVLLYEKV